MRRARGRGDMRMRGGGRGGPAPTMRGDYNREFRGGMGSGVGPVQMNMSGGEFEEHQ